MQTKQIRVLIESFVNIFLFCVLVFLLWQKLQYGITRYFDADELAYLHWAHNVFSGRVPYRDFLLYIPSGFLYILSLVFYTSDPVIAGRIFAWLIYVGICIALIVLSRSILPAIILSMFLMPADKFLEIRPDNLAEFIGLIGLISQMRKKYVLSGLFYGVSLLILPKTLPMVAVASVFAFFEKDRWRYLAGLIAPFLLFFLFIAKDFSMAFYNMFLLPFEVNKIGNQFAMRPDLFFYPNDVYYGFSGWNAGLLVNHTLWIIGIVAALNGLLNGEFLIAGSFFAFVFVYMYGYPLKHPQYLIPIAIFVAYYAGKIFSKKVFVILLLLCIPFVYRATMQKMQFTNAEDKKTIAFLTSTIPKDAYVLDMVGTSLYYQDPYYISAVPFGQWKPYMSRSIPLRNALEKTDFIYEGKLDRMKDLSDQDYIQENFVEIRDSGLYKKKL